MSADFTWDGLDDQLAEWGALAEKLSAEGVQKVTAETKAAEERIRASYPVRTGKLRDGMTSYVKHDGHGRIVGVVENRADLAYIFEVGTQARHTAIGANRGAMPAGKRFVPVMMRQRRQLTEDIKDTVRETGLDVRGG